MVVAWCVECGMNRGRGGGSKEDPVNSVRLLAPEGGAKFNMGVSSAVS